MNCKEVEEELSRHGTGLMLGTDLSLFLREIGPLRKLVSTTCGLHMTVLSYLPQQANIVRYRGVASPTHKLSMM